MLLNLDASFTPYSGKTIPFESFVFSGGEPHIKLGAFKADQVTVTHRLNSFNDLGLLLVAVDALKRAGVEHISLCIPYFPAARQDRLMVHGEPLTVKVYADLINALDLKTIEIFDPHSEVCVALLNSCKVYNNHDFILEVMSQLPKNTLLISPDAGALKKIYKLAAHLKNYEVLECGKVRDVQSGQLSGFKVPDIDLEGRPCLIVDDICDGGGTFLGLAKALKEKSCGDLFLAVSHGIFSKGTDSLLTAFNKIFTTDSTRNLEIENIIQIPLQTILNKQL